MQNFTKDFIDLNRSNNLTNKIEVHNLSKAFNDKLVVNNITFNAEQGNIVGFLGPNGAGKTTTMRMITGYLQPTGGRVLINGIDVNIDPVLAKQKFGYLPEGAPSYTDLTVYDYLKFIAAIRGFTKNKLIDCLDRVIAQVHLEQVLNKTIDTLSKGFKRRVGLAQAILHDPPILILDEPTDGLDPNQKHEVRLLIKNMAKDKVIILSTHILEEVNAICNRVIIIANGKIIVNGLPTELVENNKRTIKLTIQDPQHAAINDLTTINQRLHQSISQSNLELLKVENDICELEEFFRKVTTSNYEEVR